MADSLIFGSFDEPIQVPAFCTVCRFIPTINPPEKHLPLDLAIEVCSRTPSFTTLDSCKLVCRDWNQLVHEPTFMPAYCKHTKNAYGFILQATEWYCNSVSARTFWEQEFVSLENTRIDELGKCIRANFLGTNPSVKIIASSKQAGILLVARWFGYWPREKFFSIGKPSTKYWRRLPLPNFRYETVAAAVVVVGSSNLNPQTSNLNIRYRLVRLSQKIVPKNYHSFHCEVFDSEEWKWDTLEDVDLGCEVELDGSVCQPVTVGNLVHWLITNHLVLTNEHQVLAFNCLEYSYFRFPLPEIQFNERDWRTLVDYEGRLGLMHTNREEDITRVWVHDIGGGWRLVREFELEPSLRQEGARPVGLYNRDIVLLIWLGKCVFYNLSNSNILRSFEIVHTQVEQIFPFRSDYEEVEL